MYKYILNIVFLTCLVSCKPDKGKDVPEIDLHHSVVLDEDQLLLGKVKDMSWENDSVLVIVDSNQDGFLHFVHLSDRKVSEYGKIGQGPDEFLLVGAVYPDMNNRPILFDVSKKECFMMQHGDEGISFRSLFSLADSLICFEMLPVQHDRYIVTGLHKHNRFTVLDGNGKKVGDFGEYPYRDEEERKLDGFVLGDVYQGKLAASPHRNRFVQAIYKAKILTFYEQSGEHWNLVKEIQESFPKYKYNSPAIETDTPVGYLDVCATEKYVYALYSGKNYRDDKDAAFSGYTIEVYGWDGTLQKRYQSDVPLKVIEVSKDDGSLYAIAYHPDPVLVRFPLNL